MSSAAALISALRVKNDRAHVIKFWRHLLRFNEADECTSFQTA